LQDGTFGNSWKTQTTNARWAPGRRRKSKCPSGSRRNSTESRETARVAPGRRVAPARSARARTEGWGYAANESRDGANDRSGVVHCASRAACTTRESEAVYIRGSARCAEPLYPRIRSSFRRQAVRCQTALHPTLSRSINRSFTPAARRISKSRRV
jgi:hypothetical protein